MAEEPKDKKPLGQSIRDLINPALDDERRVAIQAKHLDKIFDRLADQLPLILERDFTSFFNHVSNASRNNPDVKNPIIIDALTTMGDPQSGESSYSPIKRLQLPIVTTFTTFSAEDIRNLPGYIKLHEAARKMDVALNLANITAEDAKNGMPPILTINTMKSYDDGALENSMFYPNLPPPPVKFDRDTPPGNFSL
ncbi:MAG: hypothetical protein GC185_07885 [Alphaproteobacteria bacterium]|nr:hypothetical protein [Alphaproteobacteria bacterium]